MSPAPLPPSGPLALFTQSMTDVVAHEIAHSWTGNLVTNEAFGSFYLNEGFTMYLQRRISAEVHGVDVTALETITGRQLLVAEVADLGMESPLTRLTVPMADGVDPDSTYTNGEHGTHTFPPPPLSNTTSCHAAVPYEKGFALVSYLRARVGTDAAFDAWLTAYTTAFAFRSISTADMLTHFFDHFPHLRGDWTREGWLAEEAATASTYWNQVVPVPEGDLDDAFSAPLPPLGTTPGKTGLAWVPGLELMRWLHAPGFAPWFPPQTAAHPLVSASREAVTAWGEGIAPSAVAAWPAGQKQHFLDEIVTAVRARAAPHTASKATLHDRLALLDSTLGLSTATNAELRLRWSQIVALAVYTPGLASVSSFLASTGKLKYVTPIYRALLGAVSWDSEAHGGKAAECVEVAIAAWRGQRGAVMMPTQSRVDGVFQGAGVAWC